MRRLVAILLAFAIALWGISFLQNPQGDPRLDTLLLFIAAGVIFVLAARAPLPWPTLPERRPWPRVGFGLTLLAVALAAVAAALFWRSPDSPTQFSGLPLWLWLASLPLFVIGTWLEGRPSGEAATSDPAAGDRPNSRWLEWTLLLLIVLFGLFLRVYHIDTFPNGCQSDECNNGIDALDWLRGAPYQPYAETNEGQATLFTYLLALTFKLFGVGVTQMRLLAALIATLTLVAFYFLARDWLGWRIALASTALFAVSRWHLTFSRIVYELILAPLAEIVLVFFLLRALRDGRRRDWALAGLALAFGLNTYTAFRVVPVMIALFLGYWLLTHRARWRRDLEGLALLVGGAFVGIVPLGVYITQHWSVFLSRTQHISIFADIANAGGSLQPLRDNLDKVLWMFHWRGDLAALNNLPGAPLLDLAVGALVVLGLAYALRYFYKPLPMLYLLWIVTVGSVAVLSVVAEAPTARRPIGLLPVIFLLAGTVLERTWDVYLRAWRLPTVGPSQQALLRRAERVFAVALVVLVVFVGVRNVDAYFRVQAQSPAVWRAFSATEAAIGQYLRTLPANAAVYMGPGFERHSAITLLSDDRPYTVLNLARDVPLRDAPGGADAVYILDVGDQALLPLLRQIYADGVTESHNDPYGAPLFFSVRVPAAALDAARGLFARYYTGDRAEGSPLVARQDAAIDFDWTTTPPIAAPFTGIWRGAFLAADGYGEYSMELTADGAAELLLDGEPLATLTADAPVRTTVVTATLAGGFHPVELRYHSGDAPGRLRWTWRGPQTPARVAGPDVLYGLEVANQGLIGYYYGNPEMTGTPSRIQRDLFITANDALPEPFSIVWRGKLAAPVSGQYIFGLRADDGALLSIDGNLVVDNGGSHGSEYREGAVFLDQGFHDIELKYWQVGGSRDLQLSWQAPGSAREVITPQYLFPTEDAAPEGLVLPPPPAPPTVEPPKGVTEEATTPAPAPPGAAATLGTLPALPATVAWQIVACGAEDGQFSEPRGAAIDADGYVYVADTGNRRIVKLDPAGKFVTAWGQPGDSGGEFQEPFDLVAAPDGTLVVLDATQQALQRFTADGEFLDLFGTENSFYRPRGLGVAADGYLWVADTGGVRLVQLDPTGRLTMQVGGRDQPPVGEGQPTDVAVGPGGDLWAAEAESGRVWHLTAEGAIVRDSMLRKASTLDGPHLATTAGGRVLISEPEGQRIVVLALDGTPIGQLGAVGSGIEFKKPIGVAAGPDGRVVVVDTPACRVIALDLAGG